MSRRASSRLLALHQARSFPRAVEATLLFLIRDDQVLLMRKRRGHGAGFINAPGGKRETDETPLTCALRETREEVGLDVRQARLLGELRFEDLSGERVLGWAFRADAGDGEPVCSSEAIPFWCPIASVPYAQMWPGDRFWLPWLLADRTFLATLLCDGARVLEAKVTPVSRHALC